jgi:hypothetical protein
MTTARQTFVNESTLHKHLEVFAATPGDYEEELLTLLSNGVSLTPATKGRAAAILWNAGKRQAFDSMVEGGHVEVAEWGTLLRLVDGGRQRRQLERKLQRHRARQTAAAAAGNSGTVKKSTLKALEVLIARFDADGMLPADGSGATSALMKRVRRWCQTLSADRLTFFLLNFPREPWKSLADLAHLKPSDFAMPTFLPICFGAAPTPGTLLADMDACAAVDQIPALLDSHPQLRQCYSYLRRKFETSSGYSTSSELDGCVAAREALATHIPLEDALWFYEELAFGRAKYASTAGAGKVEAILTARVEAGEALEAEDRSAAHGSRLSYAKVMERVLMLRKRGHGQLATALMPRAEAMLRAIKIPTKGKAVAVFGDKSASMQVAVDAAATIASMLCACLGADLNFFDVDCVLPKGGPPKTAADVLRVTEEVRAGNCTAPAASLFPYYTARKAVDLFVVVTDEVENRPCADGRRFAELFAAYRAEVHPAAKLFFVSFFRTTTEVGQMVAELDRKGMGDVYKQFRFEVTRPDLSKVPALLGMLAVEFKEANGAEAEAEAAAAEGAKTKKRQALHEVENNVLATAAARSNSTDSGQNQKQKLTSVWPSFSSSRHGGYPTPPAPPAATGIK